MMNGPRAVLANEWTLSRDEVRSLDLKTDQARPLEWEVKAEGKQPRAVPEPLWVAERLWLATRLLRNSIVIDAQTRGGVPLLRGTRMSVAQIFGEIAEGTSIVELADDFDLDLDALRGLFQGLSIHLDRPHWR